MNRPTAEEIKSIVVKMERVRRLEEKTKKIKGWLQQNGYSEHNVPIPDNIAARFSYPNSPSFVELLYSLLEEV